MKTSRYDLTEPQRRSGSPVEPDLRRKPGLPAQEKLHRLAEIRRREGISVRAMARRLGVTSTEVRRQERSFTDIPLRVVAEWAAALRMPIGELVADANDGLPPHLHRRANLLRAMKAARAIERRAKEKTVRLLAADISQRLLAVMPELVEVSAEQDLAEKRQLPLGRIATETIPIAWLTGADEE